MIEALMAQNQNNLTNQMNKEIELALSGSWNHQAVATKSILKPSSQVSHDPGLNQSQEDLNMNSSLSMTQHLINNVALQRNNQTKFNTEEYELRKQMAKNAMQSQVSGKVRTPTNAWSGLGFSNSMPEAVIKELWNNREKRSGQRLNNGMKNIQQSPTTSLDSSVSSNGSSTSGHSHGLGHQSPPENKAVRPPPGLEDSMSNAFMNNNFEYTSILSPSDPLNNNNYSNVKCISDLFSKLGLEQYIEAFEKEEVDLTTFMSLTDEDLKELGVSTFGARKKMANAMKDLQGVNNQQMPYGSMTTPPITNNLSTGYYPTRPLHSLIDVAAHSLRW